MGAVDDTPLPPLRDDLQFMRSAQDGDGDNGFLIFDPVRHRYFRVGAQAAQALAGWQTGSIESLQLHLRRLGLALGKRDVEALIEFVNANNLVVAGRGQSKQLAGQLHATRKSLFSKVLHGYLFIKIPLIRPQKFLDATSPYVNWLGSRPVLWLIALLSLTGIYLTTRQFDVFILQFKGFNAWHGVLFLPLALFILKSSHELGHAYVATRYRCQVPVMGVAFMVMFPMLYSDVSDAWKLTDKRQRLAIDFAGMATEISLGGICLLLWNLLPEGPFRLLCFFMATTGWLMSVMINLSPFIRFDGYHILADWLGIHNLQERGFAIGRWQMRKVLFGFQDPLPEKLSPRLHRILVAYAWGTWVYRLSLFLGIALVVYFLFFKVLGIFLFIFEIVWFVGLPLWRELSVWWQRRGDIVQKRHGVVVIGFLLLGGGLLFAPLESNVAIPALAMAKSEGRYIASSAAIVDEVIAKPGMRVKPGTVLIRLTSPHLREQLTRTKLKLALVNVRLDWGMASKQERALRKVFLRERNALKTQLTGIQTKIEELVIRAKTAGVIVEMAVGLHKSRWVSVNTQLVQMVSPQAGLFVRGLVDESRVGRISAGNTGIFIAETAQPAKLSVVVNEISLGRGAGRELTYLTSHNNGGIAMSTDSAGRERPVKAVFPVNFRVTGNQKVPWLHEQRGTVVVAGKPQSLAGRFFRHAFSVLLRETGF